MQYSVRVSAEHMNILAERYCFENATNCRMGAIELSGEENLQGVELPAQEEESIARLKQRETRGNEQLP